MLPRDELVHTVASDLRYLREQWDEQVDDDSLRRSSTVLRRLLVDNELQRAWKAAGFSKEPTIAASALSLPPIPLDRIRVASAGGARYKGMVLSGLLTTVAGGMTEAEIAADRAAGPPKEEQFGLRRFIKSPCMVAEGLEVPRRILIKYVANKLGGSHFDSRRGTDPEDKIFGRLDSIGKTIEMVGKNPIYFELLSIGQALAHARDIKEFCDKVDEGRA